MTEVAIHTTALEDLYIILAGWQDDGTAAFTVLVNPLVIWLWVGGGIFLLGGIFAFWPERRRVTAGRTGATVGAGIEEEIERQVRQLRRGQGRRCPGCGAAFQAGDRFCADCGAKLTGVGKV